MSWRPYSGQRNKDADPAAVTFSRRNQYERADTYIPGRQLIDAVNVALVLGDPLLLTGEPGTGKTQLASNVAWSLGFETPLKFETKSTSTAKDLFYTYDALGRFHAAQSRTTATDARPYVRFNALGLAFLRASSDPATRGLLDEKERGDAPRRSVVLIDEIDKAPRDFPNDLLNEINEMYFRIPELDDRRIAADSDLRPIVVITSNSEKSLPDAFLRRCVYMHIPFPDRSTLQTIIESRLGEYAGGSSAFLSDSLDIFFGLRDLAPPLRKRPATAEMLAWLRALRAFADNGANPLRSKDAVDSTLSALIKNEEDRRRADELVGRFFERRK